ncbi:hypothetical protein QOT17_009461 [Balamuthia mandrillaris]
MEGSTATAATTQEATEVMKSAPSIKALLTAEGDATEEYLAIVTDVFRRFDLDKDQLLSFEEFNRMLAAGGEEPTDKETFEEIAEVFDDEWTAQGGKGVSVKGLLEMSITSMLAEPEGERRQLLKLGYNIPEAAFPAGPSKEEKELDEFLDETDLKVMSLNKGDLPPILQETLDSSASSSHDAGKKEDEEGSASEEKKE